VSLRATYGENALGWVRAVRRKAGSPVTTGTYVERADGTSSYTPGGTSLKLTSVSGRNFELKINSTVGDVLASSFPSGDEYIDASWILPAGEARVVLGYRWSRFQGTFMSDDGALMNADIRDSFESTTDSGTNGSGGYQTDSWGSQSYEGHVTFENRRVDFSTSVAYSACTGQCGFSSNQDYVFSHVVKLTLEGSVWNLGYTTGWTKQTPTSLNRYRWSGAISGPVAGQLVKRPLTDGAESLDVVLGSDRYSTRGVATP